MGAKAKAARAEIVRLTAERDEARALLRVSQAENLELSKVHARTIARLDAEAAEYAVRAAAVKEGRR